MTSDGESVTQRRSSARQELDLPVMVGDAQHRVHGTIRFDTRDLSLGGAFLRSDLLLEVGELLELELPMPDAPSLKMRATVVRVDQSPTRPGMGIAFSELSERDRDVVSAFLARF